MNQGLPEEIREFFQRIAPVYVEWDVKSHLKVWLQCQVGIRSVYLVNCILLEFEMAVVLVLVWNSDHSPKFEMNTVSYLTGMELHQRLKSGVHFQWGRR